MTEDFDSFLNRVETKKDTFKVQTEEQFAAKAQAEKRTFPCEHCAGTGKYRGVRVHQQETECFNCSGRGWFYTSKEDRFEKRQKAAANKVEKQKSQIERFDEAHPGLRAFLGQAAGWSGFAASLHQAIVKYGELTEAQLAAATGMREKSIQRDLERNKQKADAEAVKAALTPTLARLAEAFLTASAELKFPKLHLHTDDGLPVVLSRAGERSKEPGTINLTDGGRYPDNVFYGRLQPDGRVQYRNAPASVIALLERLNADPQAEIVAQGQRTGTCCICHAELTDPASIAAGIGPVCARKWGFR